MKSDEEALQGFKTRCEKTLKELLNLYTKRIKESTYWTIQGHLVLSGLPEGHADTFIEWVLSTDELSERYGKEAKKAVLCEPIPMVIEFLKLRETEESQ